MLRKRHLEVKMVKNDKSETKPVTEEVISARIVYANQAANNLFGQIGKGIVTYVLLDTFRQVMVTLAKK